MTSSLFAHFFCSRWHRITLSALVTIASTTTVSAQSLKPENDTDLLFGWPFGLFQMSDSGRVRLADLFNMTVLPPQVAIQSSLQWIDPQDPDEPISDQISLITCDASAYADNIDPLDVIANSIDANVSAIVLYSTSSTYCNYSADPNSKSSISYRSLYTVTSQTNGTNFENYIRNSGGELETVNISQAGNDEPDPDEIGSGGSSGTPSTAVAMTVLYSITAVITALFIAIIATGVIRAHRHPERYGPRNGEGQERRSRAKGIARAVLDTLPIVKFGGEREPAKPGDVEMVDRHRDSYQQRMQGEEETEEGRGAGREEQDAIITGSSNFAAGDELASGPPRSSTRTDLHTDASPQHRLQGDGNEAAGPSSNLQHSADIGTSDAGPASERINKQQQAPESAMDVAPSCSICTEDFTMGEDIRVLPCDHKFHPPCVDPWLLNVSGTCPLCRIDLRPTSQSSSAFPEGPTALAAAEDPDAALSPPLHLQQQEDLSENTRRYSGLRTVFGLNYNRRRLQNAPAAERIAALQRMRTDNESAQRQQRQQQRQRWRLSQRSAVESNDTDAQGYAGLSGDGIDGFTANNSDPNASNNDNGDDTGGVGSEEPNRRRNRMSVRLQEVFGVRTSRPESAIFGGEGRGRGREGNDGAAATNNLTNTSGNADVNTEMMTTSSNPTNTNTDMTLPEAPRLPPITL